MKHRAGTLQTYSGKLFDLLNPDASDIDAGHIAYALSMQPRYNGACDPFFSVAEHSFMLRKLLPDDAPRALHLAALLHDAHEAYVGDLTTPVKAAVSKLCPEFSDAWDHLTCTVQAKIHQAFDLPQVLPVAWQRAIKAADIEMLRFEKPFCMKNANADWTIADADPADVRVVLEGWPPALARQMFFTAVLTTLTDGM